MRRPEQTWPKVELHCHLDGIVDPAMAREICRNDPGFPVSPEELERAYPIEGYERFWRWWSYTEALEGDLDRFRPVLACHIRRLKAQSVLYTEVTLGGSEIPRDPVEAVEKLGEFREWLNGQEAGAIQVELLVGFGRNRPPERLEALAARNLALHEAGLIVGFVLAGPEPGCPVRPFAKTLARFREAGLGIEIHAGEWAGPASVWDALEYGSPHRIGHGVSLFQDPALMDVVRERQIHIEMCPTSNVKTGSISRIEEHPIRAARDLGLRFSVNTDDPGPFENSMESEYELLERVFGFSADDFHRLYTHSLEARFQRELRVPALRTAAR